MKIAHKTLLFCTLATLIFTASAGENSAEEGIAPIPAAEMGDRLALKTLADEFSRLADIKNVEAQLLLFTPDAVVETLQNGTPRSTFTGRAQIGKAFADYLSRFDTVYHQNGQQTLNIEGDRAQGTAYCTVILIGTHEGKRTRTVSRVIYRDSFVKQDGRWFIAKRQSDFVISDTADEDTAQP